MKGSVSEQEDEKQGQDKAQKELALVAKKQLNHMKNISNTMSM